MNIFPQLSRRPIPGIENAIAILSPATTAEALDAGIYQTMPTFADEENDVYVRASPESRRVFHENWSAKRVTDEMKFQMVASLVIATYFGMEIYLEERKRYILVMQDWMGCEEGRALLRHRISDDEDFAEALTHRELEIDGSAVFPRVVTDKSLQLAYLVTDFVYKVLVTDKKKIESEIRYRSDPFSRMPLEGTSGLFEDSFVLTGLGSEIQFFRRGILKAAQIEYLMPRSQPTAESRLNFSEKCTYLFTQIHKVLTSQDQRFTIFEERPNFFAQIIHVFKVDGVEDFFKEFLKIYDATRESDFSQFFTIHEKNVVARSSAHVPFAEMVSGIAQSIHD